MAQLLAPQPPEVHKALCQPGLLEHKHGLCAVLGGQVEAVCEVVLPPQEGIEVIRDEQDLPNVEGQCDGIKEIRVGTSCINPEVPQDREEQGTDDDDTGEDKDVSQDLALWLRGWCRRRR